jgi:hypothetical protein
VGTPELTNEGLKARCLLNPLLKIGVRVKIDESDVAEAKLPSTGQSAPTNAAASPAQDGVYRLLVVEHGGDTFGNDWYSDLVCLAVDPTAPAGQQVART